jgi:DHA1 family tetracycline resistance protein-like MFS transporter
MPESKAQFQHPHAVLWTICLIALLSVAGVSLPYPVLAPLFAASELNAFNHWLGLDPTLLLGIALAANPAGILLGSAVLGALSDQYGRKPVLALALVVAVIGYLLSALAIAYQQYLWFVLARFLTGLCEGSVSICRALAADLHPQIDRNKAIAWMNSALYAAWLVGPLVGGMTMHLGAYVPFALAAMAIVPCLVMVQLLLPTETPATPELRLWQNISKNNSLQLLRQPELKWVIWAQFIYTLGLNAFYEFYPLWLVETQQFSGYEIGLITAALCVVMTFVSAIVMTKFGNRVDPLPAAVLAALVFSGCLAILPWLEGAPSWLWLVLCGLPIPMVSAWFQVYCTATFAHFGNGRVMGLLTLLMCAGNLVIALVGALIAMAGAQYTLWLGAIFAAIAAWLLRYEHKQKTNNPSVSGDR